MSIYLCRTLDRGYERGSRRCYGHIENLKIIYVQSVGVVVEVVAEVIVKVIVKVVAEVIYDSYHSRHRREISLIHEISYRDKNDQDQSDPTP